MQLISDKSSILACFTTPRLSRVIRLHLSAGCRGQDAGQYAIQHGHLVRFSIGFFIYLPRCAVHLHTTPKSYQHSLCFGKPGYCLTHILSFRQANIMLSYKNVLFTSTVIVSPGSLVVFTPVPHAGGPGFDSRRCKVPLHFSFFFIVIFAV